MKTPPLPRTRSLAAEPEKGDLGQFGAFAFLGSGIGLCRKAAPTGSSPRAIGIGTARPNLTESPSNAMRCREEAKEQPGIAFAASRNAARMADLQRRSDP